MYKLIFFRILIELIREEESEETLSNGDKSDMSLEFLDMKRSSEQNDETQIIKTTNSYLLCLFDVLYQAITHLCCIIFEYLSSFENIYDVLAEYSSRVTNCKTSLIYLLLVEYICCSSFRIGDYF